MLSRKVFLVILNQAVGATLGLISLVFIARFIPKEDFGMINFALGLVGLVSFVGSMGFGFAHVKRLNESEDNEECMGTFIAAKLVLSSAMVVATICLFFAWENILGYGYTDPDTPKVAYLMLGYYFFMNLKSIFTFTFQARIKTALQEVSTLIVNIVRFIGVVAVALLSLSVYWFAGTYIIAAASGFLISLFLFTREKISVARPTMSMFRKYAVYALPLVFSSTVGVVAIYTDKVMIQLFWDARQVADYAMAQRMTLVIMGLGTAVATIVFPYIAHATEKGTMGDIKAITHAAEKYVSMVTIPAITFLIVFPTEVLHILGDRYTPAATVLQIMALYTFFYILHRVYGSQMSGLGRIGIVAKTSVFIALLNIGLNLLLIPSAIYGHKLIGLGAVGAAIALLVSKIVGFLIIQAYSRKITRAKLNRSIPLQIAAATVAAITLLGANMILPPTRIFILVPYFFLGAGMYLLIMYILKEFTRKDLDFFLNALHPGKMKSYIGDEMKGEKNGGK